MKRKRLNFPVRLSELIGNKSKKWRFVHLHRIEIIRQHWKKAAGDFIAKHVVPVRIVRKTLRVATEDSSWINEMTYHTDTILERLNQLLPKPWVEEIKVVVGEPTEPLPETRPELKLSKATQKMKDTADDLVSEVDNDELKAAIKKARLAQLRRNK